MNIKEIKAEVATHVMGAPEYWDNSTPSRTWSNRFGDVIKCMEYLESIGMNSDYEFGHGFITINYMDKVFKFTNKKTISGKHKWQVNGGKEYSCNSIQDLVDKFILSNPWSQDKR